MKSFYSTLMLLLVTYISFGQVAAISGPSQLCMGTNATYTDATPSGTWTSANTAVVTIGSASGIATPVSAGATDITYTVGAFFAVQAVTVNVLPTVFTLTGGGTCAGPVVVGLSGSQTGVNYELYRSITFFSSVLVTTMSGTGSAINFGLQTTGGVYTIMAVDPVTGCSAAMSGSATVGTSTMPAMFTVTGGGSYCVGGTGVAVGLSGTTALVSYQLYRGATAVGAPILGAGAPISFGLQTVAGTYTVIATSTFSGCARSMTGFVTVVVNPLPSAFTVTGGGSYCTGGAGVPIGLSGSGTGIIYRLYLGASNVASVAGTGSPISFGMYTTPGMYTVEAYTVGTGCLNTMTGSATVSVDPLPNVYSIGGTGAGCTGPGYTLTLSGSDVGVNYQLYLGAVATGSPVSGTGAPINFGIHTTPGIYSARGVNPTTTCNIAMSGTTTILAGSIPAAYNVIGGGNYCAGGAGVMVGLSGSAGGVSYSLYRGATLVTTMMGSGGALNFGLQTTPGTYTVSAVNVITTCTNNMTGSVTVGIDPLPLVYTMSGTGGIYCSGPGYSMILTGSDIGISYQLYIGTFNIGSPMMGTGGALNFGTYTTAGTYTVKATDTATGCNVMMGSSVTITAGAIPSLFTVTGGGSYCPGGSGVPVGLSSSTALATYQLYEGVTPIGAPLAGPGLINFGIFTTPGTYTVVATSTVSGCTRTMSGSAVVSIAPVPAAHTVTGGGDYCIGGAGVAIGLNNSSVGVMYRLYNGATYVTSQTGTGIPISFGLQTAAGTYTVIGYTIAGAGCSTNMTGSATVVINPLPTAYTISGGGLTCTGSGYTMTLSGSDVGVDYQLYLGAATVGSPVAGTGLPLNFGVYTTPGIYSVRAVDATTGCTSVMTGTATILVAAIPAAYVVIGGGSYCAGGPGLMVGLNGSEVYVDYTLYRDAIPVSTMSGTGGALNFGLQTLTGTYTVSGINTITTCTNNMAGGVVVSIDPLPNVYPMTGTGGYYCSGPGYSMILSTSDIGISYQLYIGTTHISPAQMGTGGALDFGMYTTTGTYSIKATDTATGCEIMMGSTSTIIAGPTPALFTVTGGGSYCPGGAGMPVGLSGTTAFVSYQLYEGVTPIGAPVIGTGLPINFGIFTPGTYSVEATSTVSGCTRTMSGPVVISIAPVPAAYTVTGGGNYCTGGSGVSVGLSSSSTGVTYRLYLGATNVGSLPGTGLPLDFGAQTAAGTYTVIAFNIGGAGCSTNMIGSATVVIDPLPTAYTVSGGGLLCAGSGYLLTLSGSDVGVNYQLYLGAAPVGSPMPGTGGFLSFGIHTTPGIYSVRAVDATTGCMNVMTGTATILIGAIPAAYAVIGGGTYCAGGTGVMVALNGSELYVKYYLYRDAVLIDSMMGTSLALDFGMQTVAGTYTVSAVSTITTCTNNMAGSATVGIIPLPTVYPMTGAGGYYCSGAGYSMILSGSDVGIRYQLYIGTTHIGAPMMGTGAPLDFGMYTTGGTYSIKATETSTLCDVMMGSTSTIIAGPIPALFTVTGGGNYCPGGAGVAVGVSGSTALVMYQLYEGVTPIGAPVPGTGVAINFGMFTTPGSYSVVATSTISGCTRTMSGPVTVGIWPVPDPSYMVTGGGSYCAGGTGVSVGMSGSAVGVMYRLYNGAAYVTSLPGTGIGLDFGLQTAAGNYTVIGYNIGGGGCSSNMTGSATVVINPLPSAYLVGGAGTFCTGPGYTLTLSGSELAVNYQLYLGAAVVGSPVPGTGSALTFGLHTAPGIYSVRAVNSATGCTSVMAGTTTIHPGSIPAAHAVIGGGAYCAGGPGVSVGLSGSAGGVNYSLYNGTTLVTSMLGTGGALDFGLQTAAGTYKVTAVNLITTCTNNMADSAVVTINPLPTVYPMTSGGGYYCTGAGYTMILGNSEPGISYQLYHGSMHIGPAMMGTGGPLNFGVYNTAGTYSIKATNPTTLCTSIMDSARTIMVGPTPAIFNVTGGGGYCFGGSGVTIGLSGTTAYVSYQLYQGTTPIGLPIVGVGAPISFGIHTAVGAYTVIGTSTISGCTSTMNGTANVSINPLPDKYTVTGGGNYCSGGTGVVIGLSGSTAAVSYRLYVGTTNVAILPGTGSPLSFAPQTIAGTYKVVAVTLGTGCTDTMTGSAIVSIDPTPVISGNYMVMATRSITLNGTPSGGTWTSGTPAVATVDASTGAVTGVSAGISNVTYTLPTTCRTIRTITVTSYFQNGIAEPANGGDITVAPNPSNGTFSIKGDLGVIGNSEAHCDVTDMTGKIIYRKTLTVQNGTLDETIQLGNIANGMYLLSINSAAGNKVFRLLIEQ